AHRRNTRKETSYRNLSVLLLRASQALLPGGQAGLPTLPCSRSKQGGTGKTKKISRKERKRVVMPSNIVAYEWPLNGTIHIAYETGDNHIHEMVIGQKGRWIDDDITRVAGG